MAIGQNRMHPMRKQVRRFSTGAPRVRQVLLGQVVRCSLSKEMRRFWVAVYKATWNDFRHGRDLAPLNNDQHSDDQGIWRATVG